MEIAVGGGCGDSTEGIDPEGEDGREDGAVEILSRSGQSG